MRREKRDGQYLAEEQFARDTIRRQEQELRQEEEQRRRQERERKFQEEQIRRRQEEQRRRQILEPGTRQFANVPVRSSPLYEYIQEQRSQYRP